MPGRMAGVKLMSSLLPQPLKQCDGHSSGHMGKRPGQNRLASGTTESAGPELRERVLKDPSGAVAPCWGQMSVSNVRVYILT